MTTDSENDFVCDCEASSRYACSDEPFFNEYGGKRYCVLHYPGKDKIEAFRAAFSKKVQEDKNFNFSAVWFPEAVDFFGFKFGENARFNNAIFNAPVSFRSTTFEADVNFENAIFSSEAGFNSANFNTKANFNKTTFSATANFTDARFNGFADFYKSEFQAVGRFSGAIFSNEANFYSATFNEDARFGGAIFSGETRFDKAKFKTLAKFKGATFKSSVRFHGPEEQDGLEEQSYFGEETKLNFQFTNFEKPERVSFHHLELRPHWFINVESRKFEFTNVKFKFVLNEELKCLKEAQVNAPNKLLEIALRQLADNAEANHRYRQASSLRSDSFETNRIENYWGFVPWRLDWWYWLASGYGESVRRAFLIFALLISLFAYGYKKAEFESPSKPDIQATAPPPRSWSEAMRYSVNVALLQKPEPKSRGGWGWLVTLETILGPAQAALLALALRRRFMR